MKIKKGSISDIVLKSLEELTKNGILEDLSYSAQMRYIINLPYLSAPTKRSSLLKSINRLRKKGFLEKEKNKEGEIILKLTQLGKNYIGIEEEWDGKYRVVIWDIPEHKRRLRDLFRRKLREWEFKNLQKSVWISKKNVAEKLRKLIAELEMEKWVVVIESDDPALSHVNFHDRGL